MVLMLGCMLHACMRGVIMNNYMDESLIYQLLYNCRMGDEEKANTGPRLVSCQTGLFWQDQRYILLL